MGLGGMEGLMLVSGMACFATSYHRDFLLVVCF